MLYRIVSDIVESSRPKDAKGNGKRLTMTENILPAITITGEDQIEQGEIVGTIGNSGNSNGAHCHLSLYLKDKKSKKYTLVNPDKYITFPW